jgi:hypothetical protein
MKWMIQDYERVDLLGLGLLVAWSWYWYGEKLGYTYIIGVGVKRFLGI